MLRLRQNLQPRVPNSLAVLSAVLLLISSLVVTGNQLPNEDNASIGPTITQNDSTENGLDAHPAIQAATRKGIKISLMIFRHN